MINRSLAQAVLIEALKTVIILFTLVLITRFIEVLPFSGLPVFNRAITAADILVAAVSAAAIFVFIRAGLNAQPSLDELFKWLPRAGTLVNYLVGIVSLLFGYQAFQPVIFPYIKDFEWVYMSLFLAVTLFLVAKVGIYVYGTSEALSRAIVAALNPYKETAGKEPQPKPAPAKVESKQ